MKFPTYEEMGQEVANRVLDEYEYNGKTLRQWIEIISATDINVGTKHSTNLAEVGTDCISRQSAIDAIDEYMAGKNCASDGTMMARLINELVIKRLPPAEPQIIRCKDCKHWIPYDWMFSEVWQSKNIADYPEDEIGCNISDMSMKANDFCSRAERREVTT